MNKQPLKITLPKLHDTQKLIARDQHRFRVVCAGRRSGKSRLACSIALNTALNGGKVWMVCPYIKMANIAWRTLRNLCRQIPGVKILETQKRIEFEFVNNEASIELKSADNPDGLRGEGLDLVILDECAYIKSGVWEESLRPALSDRNGKAIFFSTPKARGEFFALYCRGQSDEYPAWTSWQLPTSCNPYIDKDEIAAAERELPHDIFQQEYMAVFLEGGSGVFRGLNACIKVIGNNQLSGRYCIGVDLGRNHDYTVIVVMDRAKGHVVEVQRFTKIPWIHQRAKITDAAQKYHCQVHIDATGIGQPVVEELARSGINVKALKFNNENKADLIQGLQVAIENERITISPTEKVLINELMQYEYAMTSTGKITYNAPSGAFDDCVIALALAFDLCSLSYSGGSAVYLAR